MHGSSQPPMQKNQEQSHNQRAASASTQPQQESNQSERKNETKGKEKVANQKSNLPRKRKPNASGAKKTSIAWEYFEKLPDVKEPTTAFINFSTKQDGVGNDMVVVSQKFNNEECRKALAIFVIIDEQPFKVVEGNGFRHLCGKMQPQFILPSRLTVARDCYQLYLDEKLRLKALLKNDYVRVALITYCWTSIQN
ncbi:hypothetical protein L6164_023652 [Bauhinia variegata]|uniref:Uncharacterized protein n=1 Tax=Bauhinia variegata TaxID=167791 RepID=A0ACB9MIV2_BAUVA|nr:hypothetical protein L6164_023652 [Bauhinia variegata]